MPRGAEGARRPDTGDDGGWSSGLVGTAAGVAGAGSTADCDFLAASAKSQSVKLGSSILALEVQATQSE